MKQRTDWTDRLRERLDDASLTPPAEGWQRLDEALRRQAPQPRRRPLGGLPLRYRLPLAAALLVGALLTGFYLRPTFEPDPAPLLAVTGTSAPHGGEAEATARETAAADASESDTTAAETAGPPATAQPTDVQSPSQSTETHRSSETPHDDTRRAEQPSHAGISRPSHTPQPATEAQHPNSTQHSSSDADRHAYVAALRPQRPNTRSTTRTRTSLGLFGGGVLAADRNRGTSASACISSSSLASLSGTLLNSDLATLRQNDYARSEFDHHRPWSFGLALRKGFGRGLAIETGLVYTQLRSEVRMRGNTLDQRLHLLGVPLRFDWSFVDRPRGGLYVGAGGMVECCLRARLGDERRSEHGLQASLAAVIGGEYRFTRFAALYAEPEWSYALTETKLRTIRTDHPSTFTLRVGVRFSF